MRFFIQNILFPILSFAFSFLIILHIITNYNKTNTNLNYTLKSYKNTVALYNGEKIIKIYNNIVLNTLPQTDIQNFNKGIPVSTQVEAELYLEDFDN